MNSDTLNKLYKVETLLKVVFIVSPLLLPSYSLIIAVVVCLMAVYRRQKRIEFSRQYLSEVLKNEYGLNLLFILSFVSQSSKSLFFYGPLVIHFLTGINEYISIFWKDSSLLAKYPSVVPSMKGMRGQLMVMKSKLEFAYFLISIVSTLFNFSKILSLIVYGQFMLVKMKSSAEFNIALAEIDAMLMSVTGKVGLQGVYGKIRDLFSSVKNRLVR